MRAKGAVGSMSRRIIAGGVAVAVALALVVIGSVLRRASSKADTFYSAPKSAPTQPGKLLRSDPFVGDIPADARAWRVLYTTTTYDGRPAVASGIVVASRTASVRPQPVVVWAHGTTGYATACAPSLTARPFGGGILQDVAQMVRRHWVVVAPDYTGMGAPGKQPYLVGQGEARSVLDAVRASRQLKQLSVSNRAVVWGHSQGGGAALWTGQLQPTYAPDIELEGVAAIAPTSDMAALARYWNATQAGRDLMAFTMASYDAAYPDVRATPYLKPAAVPVVPRIAQRCGVRAAEVWTPARARKVGKSLLDRSPNTGPLESRLRENTPVDAGGAPLLLAQGGADKTVPATMQRAYARMLCVRGQRLDYREYPGRDHSGVEATGAPLVAQLMTWTERRWSGDAAPDNCSNLTRESPTRRSSTNQG